MKKTILSALLMGTLAFLANAVTNMCVKTKDGQVVKYDVENVSEVYYEEEQASTDTTATDTSKKDIVTISGQVGNYDYVDLGLPSGLKWATYNVGASTPTEYGDYFAWGETEKKENYSDSNYKWFVLTQNGMLDTIKKYNSDIRYNIVDSLTTLEATDDAATANWGSNWRMPTHTEQQELLDGCNWKWTDDFNGSGVSGQVGTSKSNGNTIFLPAAGYYQFKYLYIWDGGEYWSSTYSCPFTSDMIRFNRDEINCYSDTIVFGRSVRAVVNDVKEKTYFTVNFYTSDSTLIESQKVEKENSATYPVTPKKTGYDFIGWSTSIDTITSNLNVYAQYEKQLPNLYVDVEEGDSVEFMRNGKTGYFLVVSASTSSISLNVVYNGNMNNITLTDAASGAAYCGRDLSLMQLSDAVANPANVMFAKTTGMARICSPTSVTNTIIAGKSLVTSFQLYSNQVYIQGVSVSGSINNYTYVDLGLPSGTKWATYNVGASKPTEYGEYFYIYEHSTESDSVEKLPAEADVASQNWGTNWRMPTYSEQLELSNNCDWEWTDDFNRSGIAGIIGTSKTNGNTIFLPAAGYRYYEYEDGEGVGNIGIYWSSSLYPGYFYPSGIYTFSFESEFHLDPFIDYKTPYSENNYCSVRAVVGLE